MTTDYRKQKLQGRSFVEQTLEDVDFSGADLRGANFAKSTLTNVNFQNARFGQRTWTWGVVWLMQSLMGLMAGGVLIWLVIRVTEFFTTQQTFPFGPRFDLMTQNLTVAALVGSGCLWGLWRKNWAFAVLTGSVTALILLASYSSDENVAELVGFAAVALFGVVVLSALNAALGGWAMTLTMLTVLLASCLLILLAFMDKAVRPGIVVLFIGPTTAMLSGVLSAYWANASVDVAAIPQREEPLLYKSVLFKTCMVTATLVGAFVGVEFATGVATIDLGSCIALAVVGIVLGLLVFAGGSDYLVWAYRKMLQPMVQFAHTLGTWRKQRFLTSFREAQLNQVDFSGCDMNAANLHGSVKQEA